jgi:hypothetical protein
LEQAINVMEWMQEFNPKNNSISDVRLPTKLKGL